MVDVLRWVSPNIEGPFKPPNGSAFRRDQLSNEQPCRAGPKAGKTAPEDALKLRRSETIVRVDLRGFF